VWAGSGIGSSIGISSSASQEALHCGWGSSRRRLLTLLVNWHCASVLHISASLTNAAASVTSCLLPTPAAAAAAAMLQILLLLLLLLASPLLFLGHHQVGCRPRARGAVWAAQG
jgi:hypothetical protein